MNYQPDFYSSDEELDEFEDDYDFQEFLREQKRQQRNQFSTQLTEEQEKKQRIDRFQRALTSGKLEEVISELEQNLDVNLKLPNDWTPLLVAASTGNYALVKELHKFGADLKATLDAQTSLMFACNCPETTSPFEESANLVQFLLDSGLDPNAVNRRRMNSLMFAAYTGNLSAVKLLVPLTDLKSEDNQGWNALFWAVDGGKIEVVEYLLDKGLPFDKTDIRGNTPLDLARENDYEEIVKLFSNDDDIEDQCISISYQMNFNDNFENLGDNEKPQFSSDVSKFLYGTRCENVFKIFQQKKISLYDLLSCNLAKLKKIGVEMPFQRKRIISGIHRFHKYPFHPKSLPTVGKNEIYSNIDVAEAVMSAVKQIISMEASLKYIENNINSDSNVMCNEDIEKSLNNIHRKITKFKPILEELDKKATQWDLEIKEPNAINSTSGLRWFPWRKTAFTLGIIIVSMTFFSKRLKLQIIQ